MNAVDYLGQIKMSSIVYFEDSENREVSPNTQIPKLLCNGSFFYDENY